MNNSNINESGFSSLSVILSVGIFGVVILTVASSSLFVKKLYLETKNTADLMDLKHYLHENISCELTVQADDFSCGSDFPDDISLLSKYGEILVNTDGDSSFDKFFVKSTCQHNEINIYVTQDKNKDDSWRHLFNGIPFRCLSPSGRIPSRSGRRPSD